MLLWSVLLPFVFCFVLLLSLQTCTAAGVNCHGKGGCSPQEVSGEGEGDVPSLWCHCASSTQLFACSILTLFCHDCLRSPFGRGLVRNYKSLKIGMCGKHRVEKEDCHISRFFLFILSSMAAPATGKRVWIHCLCVPKVIMLHCVALSGIRLLEWNMKCWVENLKEY